MTRSKTAIYDITEREPIPRGAVVEIQDYDSCSDLYYVEYDLKIYAASPAELTGLTYSRHP